MSQGPGLDDILPPVTADDIAFMADDIAEIASIAIRGDKLPLSAGLICAWWGFLLAATNFYQLAAYLGMPPGLMPIGIIQVVLGYAGTFILMHIEKKHRLFLSWRSQSIAAIWLFSGIIICIFMIGTIITQQNRPAISNVFLSLIFSLNFGAMSTARRCNWLIIPALGWIIGAILNFIFRDDYAALSLIFGVCGFAFMLVPGLALRFQEKKVRA